MDIQSLINGLKPVGSFRGSSGSSLRGQSSGGFKDKVPSGYSKGQLQQFTPEQMQLFSQLFSHISPDSQLSQLASGDESAFSAMEAPAWRQFQEAQGQLGSRFSQLAPGAMSAQRGSGFQNAAGQLGSDFAMQLASKRQELQRQALGDLMGISNSLLGQRPYDRFLAQKPQKFQDQSGGSSGWGGLIGAGIGGLGGFFAGGPAGALTGANIGYQAGSAF